MVDVTDAESKNRRNYQRGNVINYLDGDYCITGKLMVMVSLPWLVINQECIKVVAGMTVLIGSARVHAAS